VFVVVGLAVWGFNSTLFRPGSPSPAVESVTPAAPALQEPLAAVPEAAETVRLSISSEPPGARVYVDEFPLDGTTPISSAPVTGRASRTVRLELEGYEPSEASIDLTFDRNLSFVLAPVSDEPLAATDDTTPAGEAAPGRTAAAAGGAGQISLTVSDLSWLEVYQGTQRSGTPLVYTTATAGQSYLFNLPVFVHVGNAAGVQAVVDGEDIGSLGSAGQVLGRAFTQ
jgi:cytoskeleton protein RodZ